MQVQPESATDLLSPLSTNQIETARQISLQLPPDFTLVVKDHPAMYGLRSYKYLNKILKTPIKPINEIIKNTIKIFFNTFVILIPL